ncbi:MAG: 3' terminal RNA ribose 2'-O-methyltransferase Hen1 [Acidimicrobiales bacterium]
MLLTITTTAEPATDLGYLLHKNPAGLHQRDLPFGVARVVYPQADQHRCTAALIVDIDPVELVRGRTQGHGRGRPGPTSPSPSFSLSQYVNDRPYAASSFLSVAIQRMFGTAMTGRSKDRPDLAGRDLPLEVRLPVLPARGGATLVRQLFEPLGYDVTTNEIALDPTVAVWGPSRYLSVVLSGQQQIKTVLEHLFVMLPVLDDDKHYWVNDDEVDKLLRRGGDWLAHHPSRELITRRYLRHDRRLTAAALDRLTAAEELAVDPDDAASDHTEEEATIERTVRLNDLRLAAVREALEKAGARRIVDLGCGAGSLLRVLLKEPWVDQVVGVDVSWRALQTAARRLRLDEMAPRQRARTDLWQGALTYRDKRLRTFDAAAVVEVIEHLDPPRLAAFEQALFGDAHPRTVVVTTPNVEYNERFTGLAAGRFRHRDHRFEWTRQQFGAWSEQIATRFEYRVAHTDIGAVDERVGAPTQMATFSA